MKDYIEKIDRNIFGTLKNLKEPNILELEVQNGISTKKFIDLCNTTNGHLYSVGITAIIKKKTSNNLLKNKSLALRQFSIKNIIRLLWKSLKRD